MIYEKYPVQKYKCRKGICCRGDYADTAGKNAKKIEEYIRHQPEEDQAGDQRTMGNIKSARLRASSNKLSRLTDRSDAT